MRAPGHTPEGITNRIAPRRVGIFAGAALILVTSVTADQVRHRPQAEQPAPAFVHVATSDLLATRAVRVANPPASRLAAAPRTRMTAPQRRAAAIRFARAQKGKLYQLGATGMARYDCSGLTLRSFQRAGVQLPRTSRAQRTRGVLVSSRNARPGDLVSYNGHIGILSGKWTMIDAPGRGRRVVERRVFRGQGLQFRRVIR